MGIDLGTTNSVVAAMDGGGPAVITTAKGSRLCPPVVALHKHGERLAGQTAGRQAVVNSENTVYSIKRFMGRRYAEVAAERKMAPFQLASGRHDEALVRIPTAIHHRRLLGPKAYDTAPDPSQVRAADREVAEPLPRPVRSRPARRGDDAQPD